jgi:hypothetical protein
MLLGANVIPHVRSTLVGGIEAHLAKGEIVPQGTEWRLKLPVTVIKSCETSGEILLRPRMIFTLDTQNNWRAVFKFLDAALFVKRVKQPLTLLLTHTNALDKVPSRYNLTRIVLETFPYSSGSQSCGKIMSSWETSRSDYYSRG